MAAKPRQSAKAKPARTVKVSVPLGVRDHARLCGVAALRDMTVSAFAAEAIREALRGVTLIDRHGPGEFADREETSGHIEDRPSAPVDIDDPEDEADRQAA